VCDAAGLANTGRQGQDADGLADGVGGVRAHHGAFLGVVFSARGVPLPRHKGPERPAVTDGRFTDCGRSQGYAQSRLSELRELAEEELGVLVAVRLGVSRVSSARAALELAMSTDSPVSWAVKVTDMLGSSRGWE
jgi:hypothetical protein